MNNELIAIILTTHNRANLIVETLISIQNQTESRFRCFIVDDFSSDNTSDVVLSHIDSDDRFSFHQKDINIAKGLSSSRNLGLKLIENYNFEFIQFFDDDDIMHPKKLELQIKSLIDNKNSEFSICGSENFKNLDGIDFKDNSIEFGSLKNQLWDAYLTGEINFVAQVPIFRASFFEGYKFDEELFYAEEWVLFVKQFFKEKPSFSIVTNILFYRRKHNNSITSGGNRNFNVRKTSAIVGVKLFDFLSENNVHSRVSLLYFTRQFLLYRYDSKIIEEIQFQINKSFPELSLRFRLAKGVHWFMRRVILKILKF